MKKWLLTLFTIFFCVGLYCSDGNDVACPEVAVQVVPQNDDGQRKECLEDLKTKLEKSRAMANGLQVRNFDLQREQDRYCGRWEARACIFVSSFGAFSLGVITAMKFLFPDCQSVQSAP